MDYEKDLENMLKLAKKKPKYKPDRFNIIIAYTMVVLFALCFLFSPLKLILDIGKAREQITQYNKSVEETIAEQTPLWSK